MPGPLLRRRGNSFLAFGPNDRDLPELLRRNLTLITEKKNEIKSDLTHESVINFSVPVLSPLLDVAAVIFRAWTDRLTSLNAHPSKSNTDTRHL